MALNITLSGFAFSDAGGTPIQAYYQAYFRQVNPLSSDDTWNAVRQTGADGYWNVNLGDGDWLGQGGIVSPGDEVMVAFWTGGATRDEGSTVAGYIVIPLTSASVYSSQAETHAILSVVAADFKPSVSSGLAAIESYPRLTDQAFSFDGAVNGQTSTAGFPVVYATHRYAGMVVFPCYHVHVQVDWGDAVWVDFPWSTYGDPPVGVTHQWSDAPGTSLTLQVRTQAATGTYSASTLTHTIHILARSPVVTLVWAPLNPTVQDVVTFTPTVVSDPDNMLTTVDWSWDAGTTFPVAEVAPTAQQVHTFGTYAAQQYVVLNIPYDSGFGWVADRVSGTINMTNIPPVAGFSETASVSTGATQKVWADASTDADGVVVNYAWDLAKSDGAGGWKDEAAATGGGFSTFTYNFVDDGMYRLRLTVMDSSGATDTHEEQFEVVVVMAGGNTGSPIVNRRVARRPSLIGRTVVRGNLLR